MGKVGKYQLLFAIAWCGPGMATAQAREETLFWESVDCEHKPEVELYLEFWPNGAYTGEAHACLRGIAEAQAPPVREPVRGEPVRDRSRQRLLQCDAHRKANRLLTGQGGNALDCYKTVLQHDLGNAQALAGISAIEDQYIAWVRRELARQDIDRAQTYLGRLKTLNEEREEVVEFERRIAALRQAQAAAAQRQAQEAAAQRQAREAVAQRQAQAAAQRQAQERRLAGQMMAIAAGRFRMGDLGGGGEDDEKPVHSVRISPFQMGVHEVTVKQFRAFVADSAYVSDAQANRHGAEGCWTVEGDKRDKGEYRSGRSWRSPGFAQGDSHPVTCVSYNDVQQFIVWLNQKTGANYRLPTEAEWEYAARAGSTTKYHFGNRKAALCDYANGADRGSWGSRSGGYACSDAYTYTAPVGSFLPNGFGLYDMHGNVQEWVQDWSGADYYSSSPSSDPQGPGSGGKRGTRGGGWGSVAGHLRSAVRFGVSPADRFSNLGFRLVRQP